MKRWTVDVHFIIFLNNIQNKFVRSTDFPQQLGPVNIQRTG